MILSTHAVIGAAIVSAMPTHPVIGIVFAFGSHFVLDMIPHWDYKLYSNSINPNVGGKMKFNKHLVFDFFRIGGDAVIGIVVAYFLFRTPVHPIVWFLGASAAVLPDFLQFAYLKLKSKPLTHLQNFHQWIHSRIRITNPYIGIPFQIVIVTIWVFLLK